MKVGRLAVGFGSPSPGKHDEGSGQKGSDYSGQQEYPERIPSNRSDKNDSNDRGDLPGQARESGYAAPLDLRQVVSLEVIYGPNGRMPADC